LILSYEEERKKLRMRDLERLRDLLAAATADIAPEYFLLPVADADGGEPLVEYRERVYAYELYHQLRQGWPDWPYSLGGEVDKSGHPIIRAGILDAAKPDLLVHVPREMDRNLAVVEIKPIKPVPSQAEERKVKRDIEKLIAFRQRARYAAAFLLVFGEDADR
jgi:hypothetical protein